MERKSRTVLDLKKGEEGVIKNFIGEKLTGNLLTIGVLPKAKVKMVRYSPFGQSVYLKFGGYQLAIRTAQASKIIID